MGPKITVDSATLANKGLELIEAHLLFEVPYDRIEVVVHPTSIVHALVRFRDGAMLAHLGLPDMRVPISFALTYPSRSATPLEQLDLAAGLTLEFEAPDLTTFPLLALAREAGERGGTAPCAYNAANETAVAAFLSGRLGFLEIAEVVSEALSATAWPSARDLDDVIEADADARRRGDATNGSRMTFVLAIVGLGFLIFIHELGHFVVSLLLGMRPRRFYVGFPPAIWSVKRNGIEYGLGAIPLGGFVKIPGMHRPAVADVDVAFGLACEEIPSLVGSVARLRQAVGDEEVATAAAALTSLGIAVDGKALSPAAQKAVDRGLEDIGDALGPDAYWRAATWKRVAAIAAGPVANILLALVLFTGLYMSSGGPSTASVAHVSDGTAAERMGLQSGDQIVSINEQVLDAEGIAEGHRRLRRAAAQDRRPAQLHHHRAAADERRPRRRRLSARFRLRQRGTGLRPRPHASPSS